MTDANMGSVPILVVEADQHGNPNGATHPSFTMPPFNRIAELSGTFQPSASPYTGGNAFGLVQTLDLSPFGVPASSWVRLNRAGFNVSFASITGSTNLIFTFWGGGGPAATIADVTSPTWTATDAARLRAFISGTAALSGVMQSAQGTPAADVIDLQVDASSKLYMLMIANASVTYTTPGVGTWFAQFGY